MKPIKEDMISNIQLRNPCIGQSLNVKDKYKPLISYKVSRKGTKCEKEGQTSE